MLYVKSVAGAGKLHIVQGLHRRYAALFNLIYNRGGKLKVDIV